MAICMLVSSKSDRTLWGAGLVGTVQGLRDALRSRGSDLVIVRGTLEERVPALAASIGAQRVVTEDEVEYRCNDCLRTANGRKPHPHSGIPCLFQMIASMSDGIGTTMRLYCRWWHVLCAEPRLVRAQLFFIGIRF